jgi:hypothetical protein
MMKLRAVLLAIPLLLPAAVQAADVPPAKKTISLVVYGDDPCPKAEGDEIVVCAHRPDNERYRIPKELRKREENERHTEMPWGARVAELEDAQRASRPDSCSAIGSWGQTGCFAQMMSQWAAARQQMRSEANNIP